MSLQTVTPMIHVPDVRATLAWYTSIGFEALNTFEDGGEMTFAMLGYGGSQIMLSSGGRPSQEDRRDVDLYIRTTEVEADFRRLKDVAELQQGLQDTFYGTSEFIIRDPNGFWLTFGQEATEA